MALEHYIRSGGKRLRCGVTTGSCAALAASGAARLLLTGEAPAAAALITPGGIRVEAPLEDCRLMGDRASCGVRKDGGDDPDATHGLLIRAEVSRIPGEEIEIDGGEGVGRVTRPGLDQTVGSAAINSVPRKMIREAVEEVRESLDASGGLRVVISVPGGREAAEKTFNPDLGVLGGISILGTSGIVEPMSSQALIDTIHLELRQHGALGADSVILTPGNFGLDFLRDRGLHQLGVPVVKCSNFIGDALDGAADCGFRRVLLVGHIGKLIKLAGGIMNTHSRTADCRRELICAHAALCGGGRALCRALMDAATTDACLDLLEPEGLLEPVMESLTAAVERHLKKRAGTMTAGAILFSNVRGELGRTAEVPEILAAMAGKEQP